MVTVTRPTQAENPRLKFKRKSEIKKTKPDPVPLSHRGTKTGQRDTTPGFPGGQNERRQSKCASFGFAIEFCAYNHNARQVKVILLYLGTSNANDILDDIHQNAKDTENKLGRKKSLKKK